MASENRGTTVEVLPGQYVHTRSHDAATVRSVCLYYRGYPVSIRQAAAAFDLSDRTVQNWVRELGWIKTQGNGKARQWAKASEAERDETLRYIRHYWDRLMSIRAVADACGVSYHRVRDALLKWSAFRTPQEAVLVRHYARNRAVGRRRRELIAEVGHACRKIEVGHAEGTYEAVAAAFGISGTTLWKYRGHDLNPYRDAA